MAALRRSTLADPAARSRPSLHVRDRQYRLLLLVLRFGRLMVLAGICPARSASAHAVLRRLHPVLRVAGQPCRDLAGLGWPVLLRADSARARRVRPADAVSARCQPAQSDHMVRRPAGHAVEQLCLRRHHYRRRYLGNAEHACGRSHAVRAARLAHPSPPWDPAERQRRADSGRDGTPGLALRAGRLHRGTQAPWPSGGQPAPSSVATEPYSDGRACSRRVAMAEFLPPIAPARHRDATREEPECSDLSSMSPRRSRDST